MSDYLDPHVVSRIKGYELRSMRLVESFMAGMHRSKLLGISTDFAQHRQYVPGDDTRHLDWKVYARTDRFYVRQYEAETNMAVFFLLDASNSMFFRSETAAMSKFEYAATVVCTLAYLLLQQKDTFGLVLFDEQVRAMLAARGSHTHFLNMADALEKAGPGDRTSINNALVTVAPQMKRRSLIIVISDYIDQIDELAMGMGQISFGQHDMILVHVEDPIERDFPFAGQTIFLGTEREGRLLCEPRDLRHAYLAARQRHLVQLRETCVQYGYDLAEMPTDRRLDEVLSRFLALRQARRRRR
jgi:uncharacterized protein (DUF58 family)